MGAINWTHGLEIRVQESGKLSLNLHGTIGGAGCVGESISLNQRKRAKKKSS